MNGTKYLVDTNILIALVNKEQNLLKTLKNTDNIFVSCISVGELYYGAYYSQRTKENIYAINELLLNYKICYININTINNYGYIRAKLRKMGKPIPQNDIWIAAIAQENNLTIATRDKHFIDIDLIKTEYW
jgi:tRNA(fMet)-specific endonuclease VapC